MLFKKYHLSIKKGFVIMFTEKNILSTVGNTPLVEINGEVRYYAKLEGFNPFGSMKDRAALHYINEAVARGIIKEDNEIIESSSGNFAVALAAVCQLKGIKFTCVIDPYISPVNKFIVKSFGTRIIEADVIDSTGSYVPERQRIVREIIAENPKIIWANQYDNSFVRESYLAIGEEIYSEMSDIDYVFIPVSTCGTIAGISKKLKELSPQTKIIAVDLEGSRIFCNDIKERHISGIGLTYCPGNLKHACIDDYVIVSELSSITECRNLLSQSVSVGTSSGAVASAIKTMKNELVNKNVAAIFPDRGERYIDTIFNDDWCRRCFPQFPTPR
jgi:cysteine synthase A